jgi:NAD+ kinase
LKSGTYNFKNNFECIGVLGRVDSEQALSTLESLSDFLLHQDKKVLFDSACGEALGNFNGKIESLELDELCKAVDLLVVVGGDGTLLSSGRAAAKHGIPLVGVNRGSLGFLTDINPQDLEQSLLEIIKGNFLVDERFLLEARIGNRAAGTQEGFQGSALNDIVLNAGAKVTMVEYELYIDGKFVYSQSADGLIISTPTGSTAYALSGGGPIMHPDLDALVLVPICPHTLSSRPIVIDGNSEIRIVPSPDNRTQAQISCDGQETQMIAKGEALFVKKAETPLILLHPNNHEFYEACRSKLGWGTKLS